MKIAFGPRWRSRRIDTVSPMLYPPHINHSGYVFRLLAGDATFTEAKSCTTLKTGSPASVTKPPLLPLPFWELGAGDGFSTYHPCSSAVDNLIANYSTQPMTAFTRRSVAAAATRVDGLIFDRDRDVDISFGSHFDTLPPHAERNSSSYRLISKRNQSR